MPGTSPPAPARTSPPASGERPAAAPAGPNAAFPHPLDGLLVKRSFSAHARAVLPDAILENPDHAWLRRQERRLPRGVLGVIYHHDGVELVMPQGITRRPFVGVIELRSPEQPAFEQESPRSPAKSAEAERVRAWRTANREKVREQHRRKAHRRRAERDQLRDAIAASARVT